MYCMRTEPAVLTRLLTHRYAQLKLDRMFGGGGKGNGKSCRKRNIMIVRATRLDNNNNNYLCYCHEGRRWCSGVWRPSHEHLGVAISRSERPRVRTQERNETISRSSTPQPPMIVVASGHFQCEEFCKLLFKSLWCPWFRAKIDKGFGAKSNTLPN